MFFSCLVGKSWFCSNVVVVEVEDVEVEVEVEDGEVEVEVEVEAVVLAHYFTLIFQLPYRESLLLFI